MHSPLRMVKKTSQELASLRVVLPEVLNNCGEVVPITEKDLQQEQNGGFDKVYLLGAKWSNRERGYMFHAKKPPQLTYVYIWPAQAQTKTYFAARLVAIV